MKFNLHQILKETIKFTIALVLMIVYALALIYLNGLFNK